MCKKGNLHFTLPTRSHHINKDWSYIAVGVSANHFPIHCIFLWLVISNTNNGTSKLSATTIYFAGYMYSMSGTPGNGILVTPLAFNCGFARVAVMKLTVTECGKPLQSDVKEKRAHDFKELFKTHPLPYPVNTSVAEGLQENLYLTNTVRRLLRASQCNGMQWEKHVKVIWRFFPWKHGKVYLNKRSSNTLSRHAIGVQHSTKICKRHLL